MQRITRGTTAVIVALAMMLAPLAVSTAAADQDKARAHYTRGKQLFAGADYRGAMSEFAQANSLAPSPVLEFNIGLCHDRLGEKSEAVRRYKQYLAQLPTAGNRAKVEARISQIEGELAAEAAAAEAARKAEAEKEAAKPAPVPDPVPPAVAPPETKPELAPELTPAPDDPPQVVAPPPTPRAPPASVGDEGLDRVNRIDIGQIRSQYIGDAGGAGNAGSAAPPAIEASPDRAIPPPPGAPPERGQSATPPPTGQTDPKPTAAKKPVYKQWWFWVVVGVSAYVLYDITSSDSNSSNATQRGLLGPAPGESAPVLFRF